MVAFLSIFTYIFEDQVAHSQKCLRHILLFLHTFIHIQSNLNSSNTDGSFTMANSNSVLSPYEILPMDQENKYLKKLSYFITKLYVVCTH